MENKPVKSSSKTTPSKARGRASSERTQLDPARWVDTAIDLLASEGVTGLRVEVLAKRCGVTKGSFYWHFKDRQALLDAVLLRWQEGRIRDIEKTTSVSPGKERDVEERFGIKFDETFAYELGKMKPYVKHELVELYDDRLVVSAKGKIFVRAVAMHFDRYLRESTRAGGYSRIA